MAECEGSFKLFGRTIQVAKEERGGDVKTVERKKGTAERKRVGPQEDCGIPSTATAVVGSPGPPTTTPPSSRDKALRRSERSLPCPRCRSLHTKFCYYNNYNANQPRHFCKSCQRYWTAGGTMRNVPVGSGRRKSKSSASRAAAIAEATAALRAEAAAGATAVLSFASPDPREAAGEERSSRSSVTQSSSAEEGAVVQNCTTMWGWDAHWFTPPPPPPPVPPNLLIGSTQLPILPLRGAGPVELAGSIPDTLSIDDPAEAARSSIWLTVGRADKGAGGGLMRAFEPKKKEEVKCQAVVVENSLVASSNPAAFSRSLSFHESML